MRCPRILKIKLLCCWIIVIAALAYTKTATAQRAIVSANFSVYVAPATECTSGYWPDTMMPVTACGSDVTGNGTQSAPWLNPQYAINMLYANYDFVGQFAPTIVLAVANSPGNFLYTGVSLSGRLLGQPGTIPTLLGGSLPNVSVGNYNPFTLMGDKNSQLGAIINPGSGGRPSVNALSMTEGAALKVIGITFDTTSANTSDILVFQGSFLDISYVTIGNAGTPWANTGLDQIGIAWGGSTVMVNGPITIVGSGSSFVEMGTDSNIYWNNNGQTPMTVACNGTPHYMNGMFNANNGTIWMGGVTFPGCTISGPTAAVAQFGGIIDTNTGTGAINGPPTCHGSYFPPGSTMQINQQDNGVCR